MKALYFDSSLGFDLWNQRVVLILNRLWCFYSPILQVVLRFYVSPRCTAWTNNARLLGHCWTSHQTSGHMSISMFPVSGINLCLFIKLIPFLLLFIYVCICTCLCVCPSFPLCVSWVILVVSLSGFCSPEPLPCIIQPFIFIIFMLVSSRPTYTNLPAFSWKLTISLWETVSIFLPKFSRKFLIEACTFAHFVVL